MPRYDAVRNRYIWGDGPDDDTLHDSDGAITPRDGVHAITKATTAALTLAAPTAAQEGMRLIITSRTTPAAQGHAVTVAGGLAGKGAGFTVLTFTTKGDAIELLADNLFWTPVSAPYGVTVA